VHGGERRIPDPSSSAFTGFEALRVDLQKQGIEFGSHLIMQGNQKTDVNGKRLVEHIKSAFLPFVAKVWGKPSSGKSGTWTMH
jgi:hypothetical protein